MSSTALNIKMAKEEYLLWIMLTFFLGHQASQGKKLAIMNVCVGDYKY